MQVADPTSCLQFYPLPMQEFGLNHFGENMYRLILASSRRHYCKGNWIPTYWHMLPIANPKTRQDYADNANKREGAWVLEEWTDAFSFTGMTPEQWKYDLEGEVLLGPYPCRGEYRMCGQSGFDPMQLGAGGIRKLISLVHAGERYSWYEKLVSCRETGRLEEKARDNRCEAIVKNALPAFGHAAFSGYGGIGGEKKSKVVRSAQQVRLPVPRGTPGQWTANGARAAKQAKKYQFELVKE